MRQLISAAFFWCMACITTAHAVEIAAQQAILMDADTGAVLLSKQADEPMHPSSMSKLMTVYLAFKHLKAGDIKLDDTFTVSEKAWRKQGSKTFVKLGEKISVEELLNGIIVQSGNDACIVLAEGISGTEEAFASEMTRTAKTLGMTQSHFVNATGWPDDEHLMSARDLAILSQRLINDFPEYYHYFSVPEYTYSDIRQYNRNPLLSSRLGVDGLKTGHTEVAGYGITLSAKNDGRRLVLVINGLDSEKARKEEGRKLLSYGFSEFANKKLLNKNQKVAEAPVWFGNSKTVPLHASRDILVTLPKDKMQQVSYVVKYVSPIPAPVEQGQHIADLHVKVADNEPLLIPLTAGSNVAKASGFSKIKALFSYYTGQAN